jgi:hypothetical protein
LGASDRVVELNKDHRACCDLTSVQCIVQNLQRITTTDIAAILLC